MPCNSGIIASSQQQEEPSDPVTWFENTLTTGVTSNVGASNPSFTVNANFPFNTSLTNLGSPNNNSWSCVANNGSFIRLMHTLPTAIVFNKIRIINYHNSGADTENGVRRIYVHLLFGTFVQPPPNIAGNYGRATIAITDIPQKSGNNANFFDIPLLYDGLEIKSRYIAIDILSNWGGSLSGIRRIQYGTTGIYNKPSLTFDASVVNSFQDTMWNPVALNSTFKVFKSTDNVFSIEMQGTPQYITYNGHVGCTPTDGNRAFAVFNGIFNGHNMWNICVFTVKSSFAGNDFAIGLELYNPLPPSYYDYSCLIGSGSNIALLTHINGAVIYTTILTPVINTRYVMAYCLTNDGPNCDIKIVSSGATSPLVVSRSGNYDNGGSSTNDIIQSGTWTGGQQVPIVSHEFQLNTATDDTIMDVVNGLRTKWDAL
jgi:hypothetical protein